MINSFIIYGVFHQTVKDFSHKTCAGFRGSNNGDGFEGQPKNNDDLRFNKTGCWCIPPVRQSPPAKSCLPNFGIKTLVRFNVSTKCMSVGL